MKKFIEELKRRNVIKSALAYLVVAWVLLQVFQMLLPMVDAPDWALKGITIIMAIGLPVWIIVSWAYDITPQGIEKTTKDSGSELVTQATNKRLNAFIIASLSIAVIVLTLKLTNVFEESNKQYAIAVLPFNNIQIDKGSELLSESFAYDVYSYISKMSKLQVSDFYSAMRYKNTDKTNAEIGKELNVTYLLRATVRQVDNNLSITIDLIDAKSNNKDWTKTYDEVFEENTLDIQQRVSQKIVQELRIKLTPQEEKTLERKPTENVEALYWFTKGREIVVQRELDDNWTKGLEYFQKAIALDSTYAEAYAEIAQAYLLIGSIGDESRDKLENKVNAYLDKALELNPDTFRAYAIKAMMIQSEDWKKGAEYFEKAIAINPNDASVHMQYGLHLRWRPDSDLNKSLNQFKIAQQLNPHIRQKNVHLLNAFVRSGKVEEAEELFNEMRFILSEEGQLNWESDLLALKSKDWEEKIRFYESKIEKDSNNAYLNRELGSAYDRILNDDSTAIKYLKRAYQLDSTNSGYASHYHEILIEGKEFAAAKKLFESKNFKTLVNKRKQLESLWKYYYYQEDYKKAREILNKDSLVGNYYLNEMRIYAQLGDRKTIDSLFTKYDYFNYIKIVVYAILKEKDSMYNYMEKMSIYQYSPIHFFNSLRDFDPYRKEERFKAFLRKHYLPITHWNE